jgi:hydrogenase maturation protease
MKPILVLGLGNDILKDDAVGLRVAEQLAESDDLEIHTTSQFGLSLLDDMIGREKVLIIDSYACDDPAAQPHLLDLDSAGSAGAPCPHFVGLAEIREVLRSLELGFPRVVQILAVPAPDPWTFSTRMSPGAKDRITKAVALARRICVHLRASAVPPRPPCV